jgi:hypothetical protein
VKSLPPEIPGSCGRFSDIEDLRRVPTGSDNQQAEERIRFQIIEIVVKFTTKYRKDLHQFCPDMECASRANCVRKAFWWLVRDRNGIYSVSVLHRQSPLYERGESWLKEMDSVIEKE